VAGIVSVASNKFSDAAGNQNADGADANNAVSIAIDTVPPTIALASNKASLKAGETANITFTFSEDPSHTFAWDGLTGDIAITGGTLGAISGIGLTRTAVFTPTVNLASGNASITVSNLSYTDSTGNTGIAGTSPSISIDTLAPIINSVA
jgi:hypothetical protein